MHYCVRAATRIVAGELKRLVVTACGYRANAMNTTRDPNAVTCRVLLAYGQDGTKESNINIYYIIYNNIYMIKELLCLGC